MHEVVPNVDMLGLRVEDRILCKRDVALIVLMNCLWSSYDTAHIVRPHRLMSPRVQRHVLRLGAWCRYRRLPLELSRYHAAIKEETNPVVNQRKFESLAHAASAKSSISPLFFQLNTMQ